MLIGTDTVAWESMSEKMYSYTITWFACVCIFAAIQQLQILQKVLMVQQELQKQKQQHHKQNLQHGSSAVSSTVTSSTTSTTTSSQHSHHHHHGMGHPASQHQQHRHQLNSMSIMYSLSFIISRQIFSLDRTGPLLNAHQYRSKMYYWSQCQSILPNAYQGINRLYWCFTDVLIGIERNWSSLRGISDQCLDIDRHLATIKVLLS